MEQIIFLLIVLSLSLFIYPSLGREVQQFVQFLRTLWHEVEEIPKLLKNIDTGKKLEQASQTMPPALVEDAHVQQQATSTTSDTTISNDNHHQQQQHKRYGVDYGVQVSDADFWTLELRAKPPFRDTDYRSIRTNPEYWRSRKLPGVNIDFNNTETVNNIYELNPQTEPCPDIPSPRKLEQQAGDNTTPLVVIPPLQIFDKQQQSLLDKKHQHEKMQPMNNGEMSDRKGYEPAPIIYHQDSATDVQIKAWTMEAESVSYMSTLKALQNLLEQKIASKHPVKLGSINLKDISLFLTRRSVTQVPLVLIEANQITHLDLSDNYITSLPNWFFDSMKQLTSINLSYNFLTDLSDKFAELKKLKDVNLSHNKFDYFPPALFNLYYLTTLDISFNQIAVISNEVSKLKNSVVDLNLSGNMLVEFPDEFKNLKRIKFLRWSDNLLLYTAFSETISKLTLEEPKKILQPRKRASSLHKEESTPTLIGSSTTTTTTTTTKDVDMELPDDKANHSPLTSSAQPDNVAVTRAYLLLSVLENERRYVRWLNVLYELYYVPLRMHLSEVCKEFEFTTTEKIVYDILPNHLNALITFNRAFLTRLLERLSPFESNPMMLERVCIGDVYLEHIHNFTQLYAGFVNIYDRAITTLRVIRKENPEFDKYLNGRKKLLICDTMDLESLLLLPIHRIPKQNQFLKQLLKSTLSNHEDYKQLRQSLKLMETNMKNQDEHVFQINNKYKILEIQKKLKLKRLYVPSRILVREGKLILKPTQEVENIKKMVYNQSLKESYASIKSLTMENVKGKLDDITFGQLWDVRFTELPVHVYLFNDILLIKELSLFQKILSKQTQYLMHGAELVPNDQSDTAFDLLLDNRKRALSFSAESKQEKMLWINDFSKVMNDLKMDSSENSDSVELGVEDDDEKTEVVNMQMPENTTTTTTTTDNDAPALPPSRDPSPPSTPRKSIDKRTMPIITKAPSAPVLQTTKK